MSDSTTTPIPGPSRRIEYHLGHWTLFSDDADEPTRTFNSIEQALRRGYELASEDKGVLYLYADGALADRFSAVELPTSLGKLYQVSPTDEGWAVNGVSATGSEYFEFNTKKEAVSYARDAARHANGVLVIFDSDGNQQRTHDYRAA